MWMMFYLFAALAKAEPVKIEGLEVLRCANVAASLEEESKGYEWRHVKGEVMPSGVVMCEVLLEKNNHQVIVRGTLINDTFTIIEDEFSWIAEAANAELV